MTIKNIILAAVLLSMPLACDSLTRLEERMDELEARIKAIETVLPTLNSNIQALQAISGSTYIQTVEQVGSSYKLTLADGQTIYIKQGSIGIANTPILSIDKDGSAGYRD